MPITPTSSIYFCNVPWNGQYNHVCDAADMITLLTGSPLIQTVSNYTYVRKDSAIIADLSMDDLIGANYVAYRNAAHENQWFYAFIEEMNYKGDLSTEVKIKTDVYQTWRSVIDLPTCFVEREHVNDDTIGLHTVPENLETGDFIFYDPGSSGYSRALLGGLGIVIAVTEVNTGTYEAPTWDPANGTTYNGIFSGVKLYGTTSAGNAAAFLSHYVKHGKTDSIVAVYMIPSNMLNVWTSDITAISGSSSAETLTVNAPARPSVINGYTPVNNKLLTHPYVHLSVDNNAGNAAIFKYEDFQATPQFEVYGGIMPNPTYKCFPKNLINSNGAGNGLEYGLTISGYPICAWSSDSYAQWLAQNALPMAGTTAASIGAIIGGAVSANPLMIAGGIGGVLSQVQALHQRSLVPDQLNGSLNAGSANNARGWNDFYFHIKTIKAEYARIIDDFLSMYGYKINRVKLPNLTGRVNYNYVKTNDCIVKGGIPENDRRELVAIFDRGVTIWHSLAGFGNYAAGNAISS